MTAFDTPENSPTTVRRDLCLSPTFTLAVGRHLGSGQTPAKKGSQHDREVLYHFCFPADTYSFPSKECCGSTGVFEMTI